ncbi:MAG TPA: TIGR02594 family protein [Xanthobacteraceae bacterium]|nr:TIGR02594 family protein [Xanthobacteraceae bacterium]
MTPKWYQIAMAELGQQEFAGTAHNPRIVEYHQATGLRAEDDEMPWCGAFVAWCLGAAGIPYDKASAASARAWLDWGRALEHPTIGCVVVFWRGRRDGWQGHVGFYAGRDAQGRILVLGGNQGNAVSVRPYSADQLLGYRWPASVPLPPDIQPLRQSGVVQGSTVAAASGAAVVAENLPMLVSDLERADGHLQAGTLFGVVIGLLIIAGAGWALWQRIRAARELRDGVAP